MAKSKKSKPAVLEPKSPSPAASKSPSPSPEAAASESHVSQKANEEKQQTQAKETFDSYYLKRITAEFADDIDKIRSAPDFGEKSVPILIQALKQSGATFTEEEKQIIMGAQR